MTRILPSRLPTEVWYDLGILGKMARKIFMEESKITKLLLEAIPYPVVFADTSHTIRYMNRRARFEYEEMRGHQNLLGSSLLDCHNEQSRQKIREIVARFEKHGTEQLLTVTSRNQRVYMTPVHDENGCLVGYFERYELNQQI
jgi:nitrogen-specific signal transduction histidine kinase